MSDSATPPSSSDSSLLPLPISSNNGGGGGGGNSPPKSSPTIEDTSGSSPNSPPPLPEETPANSPPPPSLPESPPPDSSSPPPPTVTNSPPPVSNSPPPSSPPPSPQNPTPVVSPPPEKSSPSSSPPPPTSKSKKSPPPQPEESPGSSPPPPKSSDDDNNNDSPPPSPPSPDSSEENSPPPPSQEFKPPPNSPPSPPPPSDESAVPPAIPSSNSPALTPTPPSSRNSTGSRSSSNNSGSSSSSSPTSPDSPAESNVQPSTFVGVAAAGVFLVALIALFFVCSTRRRRRKRSEVYAAPPRYIPAGTTPVKSDGYYSGGQQQHNINFSGGPGDSNFYSPPTPNSYAANNHSHGSQRGHGGSHESGLMGGPNPYFSYEEASEMTNGFSRDNVLGEGGFGCVYKGVLPDGKEVAVKQLKAGSGQGEREFKAEVEIISRVHHRHLVSLVGYCISEHQRLLIYEFVSNNTLEHHLHGRGMPVLDWSKRLKIALGAAKGLAYLHEDCHPKIIHRDIKSANILLEDSFEAQVADFGLAKPSNDTHTHVSTRVMGTFGYMAPEYASSGKLTDKSDVFSFGVVLLELITGRKSVDPTRPLGDESLVEWARPLLIRALESGDLRELVDPRLEDNYVEGEMTRMVEAAAACVRHSAPKRPRMVQVARALDCEGEMTDLSNGVKYGQSTIYESGQYNQDIMKFRRMALEDSSEYDKYSGEFGNSRETPKNSGPWIPRGSSSGESETRAFNSNNFGEQRHGGPHSNFGARRF